MNSPSPIKLYLDEMIPVALAEVLRQYGYDVITARDADMLGKHDDKQLEFATSQGRVILTFNVKHFPKLHEAWLKDGKSHGGIIVSPEIRITQFRRLLSLCLRMLNSVASEEVLNSLHSLQEFQ